MIFFKISFVNGQSQGEINRISNNGLQGSKAELEGTINRINALYSNDQDFIAAFKISNEVWVKYRDAQLKMKFPAKNPRESYGSMYSMCFSGYLEELTRNRIKELRIWANEVQEGEVCAGSVHFKKN